MKHVAKNYVAPLLAGAMLLTASQASAQVTVGVNPAAPWGGYMNVFRLPSDNGGGYEFGSSWGVGDLNSSWSGPILTLSPNTIGDPNSYWYTPSGGPGATGNKIMDANLYVETTGVYTGQALTFEGLVLSSTLLSSQDANGNGWTSVAFIKDFAADYSSFNLVSAPLVNGIFSITMNTVNDPARHVQYGFETKGPNVWATDVAPYGNIQITMVPEPGSVSLLLLGLAGVLAFRRR